MALDVCMCMGLASMALDVCMCGGLEDFRLSVQLFCGEL